MQWYSPLGTRTSITEVSWSVDSDPSPMLHPFGHTFKSRTNGKVNLKTFLLFQLIGAEGTGKHSLAKALVSEDTSYELQVYVTLMSGVKPYPSAPSRLVHSGGSRISGRGEGAINPVGEHRL